MAWVFGGVADRQAVVDFKPPPLTNLSDRAPSPQPSGDKLLGELRQTRRNTQIAHGLGIGDRRVNRDFVSQFGGA